MWEPTTWLTMKACFRELGSRLSRADPVIKLNIKGCFHTLGSRLYRIKPVPGLSMKAFRDLNSPRAEPMPQLNCDSVSHRLPLLL